jgi:hypothetical protein
MLNTISPQFLQSLQPLQTAPTVKLPVAPRTCHHSIFVVHYNTRQSLLVWLPTQGLHISVVLLVAPSRNQLENITTNISNLPPPSQTLTKHVRLLEKLFLEKRSFAMFC